MKRSLGIPLAAWFAALVAVSSAWAQPADMTEGEVRKLDRDNRKVTLRHGEIKHLQMPPMTMVFEVKDAALLEKLKNGDKVRFRAEQIGGVYTVTAIEPRE
jgi:Cu(I)/Ag(I) efflux system periplasmic protein CusF